MKELVLAIIEALQAGQVSVEPENISVSPSLAYIPPETRTPAFCVKDGFTKPRYMAGGVIEYTLSVFVVAWVQIPEVAGASLIGEGDEKGVLDLAAISCSVLNGNLLGISGMQSADIFMERPSEMGRENSVQRKVIEFRYVKETEGTCGS